jgi:ribonuclease HI
MGEIHIYTDGSCDQHDNKRPGGWAYDIYYQDINGDAVKNSDSGGSLRTTNVQMELMAILQAIHAVKKIVNHMLEWPVIFIHTDSETAIGCLTNPSWNCKKDKSKGYVMYLDEIEWATGKLNIKYIKVAAHMGIQENEEVNARAVIQRKSARSRLK